MLQNIPKEKILEVVNQGPTLPAKIAKQIGSGGDTMLIGAILSTLASSGEIRVSTLKVGGSPLYYVPDQESKLEDFINYLNEKDKKAFKILKEQKVLQDSEQDPLMRVSLRTIKDFAKQFECEIQGQKLLCWRFYSVSKEEALDLAKNMFVSQPLESKSEIVVEKPIEKPVERIVEKEIHVDKTTPMQQTLEPSESIMVEHATAHAKHEHKEHKEHKTVEKHTHHEHESHRKPREHHEAHTETTPKVDIPKTEVKEEVVEAKPSKHSKSEYNFFELILNHVTSMKLDLISKEKIKKTEYDLILKNHETNEYIYCKAKDKPTINEGDLAPALIFAQNKKMPCIFMSTGELTKTAAILITREFSGIKFEKIVVSQ